MPRARTRQNATASPRLQRINTAGGVAPAGACPTTGTKQRVDYTADYLFYR